jgi:D-tyrosyl-tRNA(Tyr) deacylase
VRALIQRVSEASVEVDGGQVAEIAGGLLVLVAVGHDDGPQQAAWLAAKVTRLRVFADDQGRMNLSLADIGGQVLVVSQFTLYGDVTRGNRPSFVGAASPEQGERLVEQVAVELERLGVTVGRGRFGAHMRVALVNDGPVTIWVETP